ncbi:MAG: hypothetical protein IKV35_04985 [Clostridia bacterium]|nr:hypothetical protein [Clostridia bacterium]
MNDQEFVPVNNTQVPAPETAVQPPYGQQPPYVQPLYGQPPYGYPAQPQQPPQACEQAPYGYNQPPYGYPPPMPAPPLPEDLEEDVDKAFSKSLASVVMAQFPIVSIVSLIFSIIAHKQLNAVNRSAKQRGIRSLGGKATAARILSSIGLGTSIYTTATYALVFAIYALYFFFFFIAIMAEGGAVYY